jgi:HME family heavy-metal exporter
MEGRLFRPLGLAYIVSIISSLLVSLTVTPVLSYWLLTKRWSWFLASAAVSPLFGFAFSYWVTPSALSVAGLDELARRWSQSPLWLHGLVAVVSAPLLWLIVQWTDWFSSHQQEGPLLYLLKSLARSAIRLSLFAPWPVLSVAFAAVAVSLFGLVRLENDFLPPFDEGAVQINAVLPPGTSLATSAGVARRLERRLQQIPEIVAFVRKTGRAELDEHAVPVSSTEVIATLDTSSGRSREEILGEIREAAAEIPGIVTSVEQPLAHLISHMLSGVRAHIGIKVYGDSLGELRRIAQEIRATIADVEGVTDLQVEPQREIPQLRIEINGDQLRNYGLVRHDVNQFIETAMNGEVVSQILLGQRTFDLLLRLEESSREDIQTIKRLSLTLPDGGTTSLDSVAHVYRASGPNTINREQVQRRIVVQCNTTGRGLVDVVQDIQSRLRPLEESLPTGYFIEYGGQFESQQSATRKMLLYFAGAIVGMFLVLYSMFRSANLALQVMFALPMAFIGSVAALYVTGQTLTVAAMVGFISLSGIATRNGILLISHYLHLVRHEGEAWSWNMIVRAGQERVAPVLMTALTSGMGLLPLALAAGEAGKEILYPVATVIIGGLITSTLLEFLVRPALFWKFGLAAVQGAEEEQVPAEDDE